MKLFRTILLATCAILSGCTCEELPKPNLSIPYTVTITNPYNGAVGTYINEWYYCPRFAQPWPCYYDCNYVPNGYTCNGWNNQNGYFYWGQCIPPLQPGDVVTVYKYIFNIAPVVNNPSYCKDAGSSLAGISTTRIIVKDENGNSVETNDKQQAEIPAGGYDVFTYQITYGQNGAYTYEVITDFFHTVDESDTSDNSSGVPGLTFH